MADPTFVLGTNTEDAFSTGRPDKIIATSDDATAFIRLGRPDEHGKSKWNVYIGIHWVPEDDSGFDPFWESSYAAPLSACCPSKDGTNLAGLTIEDYMSLLEGGNEPEFWDSDPAHDDSGPLPDSRYCGEFLMARRADFLAKGFGYHKVYAALKEADEKSLVDWSKPGLRALWVGLKCRLDRVPDKGPDGKPVTYKGSDGIERESKTLVVTRLESVGKLSAGKSGTKSTKGAPAATESKSKPNGAGDSDDSFDAVMSAHVLEVTKENGGKLPKAKLISLVPKKFTKKEDRAEAMSWLGEEVNLVSIDGATYDTDSKVLTLD